MTSPTRIAVIGVGSMGSIHARVVWESPRAHLVQVIDPCELVARELAATHGAVARHSVEEIDCDAAIVAVPTTAHADVALPLLRRGIPLLIEKPLASTRDSVTEIIATSRVEQVAVMCGFVERFNPVVRSVYSMLDGPIRHLLAQRHSPPADRIRSSVVNDLLIHDLDVASRFVGLDQPERGAVVSGSIAAPTRTEFSDLADCTVRFRNGSIATLSAGRIGHRKVRSMSIITDTCLYELDLLRQNITLYRHKEHSTMPGSAGYRSETVVEIPFVRVQAEPLAAQFDHFLDLVIGEADPETERAELVPAHELAFRFEEMASLTAVRQKSPELERTIR